MIAKRAREMKPFYVMEILEKAKVGVTPGIDFGQQAEGYLRFSYTTSQKRIREGLRRLEEYLKGFQGLP